MSDNRVIGHKGKIPWYLPDDFKWFKKMTTGQIIVMGRKTFESIGQLLPNRTTFILTRTHFQFPGAHTISDLGQIESDNERRDIYICGGAQVYEQALPFCSDLYLTRVKRVVEGDVFFPRFENQFELVEEIIEGSEFKILHYRNRVFKK